MDAVNPLSATNQVTAWLSAFGKALEQRNVEAAAALFATECYWRDLVAFTWNIKTRRRARRIAAMLKATLAEVEADGLGDRGRGERSRRHRPRRGSPLRRRARGAAAMCV